MVIEQCELQLLLCLSLTLITYWIDLDPKDYTRDSATVLSSKMSCLSANVIFGGDKKLHVLTHGQFEITHLR